MQTILPIIPIVRPDLADEVHAGRPFPARDALVPLDHTTAAAHLSAIHGWWLDVAAGYCRVAEGALANGDVSGADEAVRDGSAAFAQATRYAPSSAS